MLQLNRILVKEQVGMFKLADRYDLFDPETGRQVGACQEKPAWYVHVLRFMIDKRVLPTVVEVVPEGRPGPLFVIRRGFRLFRAVVQVEDAGGRLLGTLRGKILSFKIDIAVLDAQGREIARVLGDWKGWNFKLTSPQGTELGTITKKWAGIGKELFTSADNYMIELAEDRSGDAKVRTILLAAALAIDIGFKEGKN